MTRFSHEKKSHAITQPLLNIKALLTAAAQTDMHKLVESVALT